MIGLELKGIGAQEISGGQARQFPVAQRDRASEMSHGGFKQSGYGKDMSAYAVEDYTIVKHVMAKLA